MKDNKENNSCCSSKRPTGGFGKGLIAGFIPHSFCILFIIFSLLGSVFGASVAQRFLLIPNFFPFLIALSLVFATFSAWIYLRRQSCCSAKGLKGNWKYLAVLYGTTLAINIVFIYLIFPALATVNNEQKQVNAQSVANHLTIKVDIPCSGHASLIISELKKAKGVSQVSYVPLETFEIGYGGYLILRNI